MDWWWTLAALTAHLGTSDDDRWARVLTGLDLQRAQAFADADTAGLDRVYLTADAAASDADTIGAYADRGSRVVGAVLRVERVEVRRRSDRRVTLDVVDRLGPARVVWDDGSVGALPRDRPTARVVVLVWTAEGWRISASRPRGPS